jgi:sulfur carrier protein ThiS
MERTLKANDALDGAMRIIAEILPGRREESVDLNPEATGMDLLRSLRLAPDAHILVRHDAPIAADELLREGDRIRVVGVVSGGSVA